MSVLLSVFFSWSFTLGYLFQSYFVTTAFLCVATPAWFALQETSVVVLDVLFQEVFIVAGALTAYFFVKIFRVAPFWVHSHWSGLISACVFSSLYIGAALGWHFWRNQEWSFLVIAGIQLLLTFGSFVFAPYDTFRLGPNAERGNSHFWLAVGVAIPVLVTGTLEWAVPSKPVLLWVTVSMSVLAVLVQVFNLTCNVMFMRLMVSEKMTHAGQDGAEQEEITFQDVVSLLENVRTRTTNFAPQWNFSIDQVD